MRSSTSTTGGGALAYLAAYDVRRAQVFGRCESTTGSEPFGRLVNQVMTTQPFASAPRVFWVVEQRQFARWPGSVDRSEGAWDNLRLIHLPVHASWLDHIEIYVSILQRKALSPNDFTDLARSRPASPPSRSATTRWPPFD